MHYKTQNFILNQCRNVKIHTPHRRYGIPQSVCCVLFRNYSFRWKSFDQRTHEHSHTLSMSLINHLFFFFMSLSMLSSSECTQCLLNECWFGFWRVHKNKSETSALNYLAHCCIHPPLCARAWYYGNHSNSFFIGLNIFLLSHSHKCTEIARIRKI